MTIICADRQISRNVVHYLGLILLAMVAPLPQMALSSSGNGSIHMSSDTQTVFAVWNLNGTNNALFIAASTGTGTLYGYGQAAPATPLSNVLLSGTLADPGLDVGTNNYNRSVTVNPPLISTSNNSVGVVFRTSTTGATGAIKISWSQTIGYRSSRYWQILASANGTNGPFFIPTNGIGCSITQLVTGLTATNSSISGTATVHVSSSGLIDFRTINNISLSPAQVTTTPGAITRTNYAAGFIDNISFTFPTGMGLENNTNFAFAIAGAYDPDIPQRDGTNALVSSYSGTSSLDTTNGYNRSASSGGSMRLDLVTVYEIVNSSVAATVTLGNLSQTYDGTAKSVTFSTDPTNLAVEVTYNGSTNAPISAGSYTVIGTVTQSGYTGAATNTLVINKATPTATLSVDNSPVTFDGIGKSATVSVTTSSVPGSVANILTGGQASQTNAGTYAVTADFVPTDSANYASLTNLAAGEFVITSPPYSYAVYSNLNGLVQGPEGDDDGDGFANLYEYFTGTNPTNFDSGSRISGTLSSDTLTVSFPRQTNATDATLYVEGAFALTNGAEWITFATNQNGSWGSSTNITELGGPDTVTVSIPDPAGTATNRYLRVRITLP